MTNEEIQNIFFLECEEALSQAEEGLMACQSGTADAETVNGIFRSVHSIKGGAGAFSFTLLQAFTHKFETVLSYVRDGDLPLGDWLNALMLRAFDVLADHVTAARGEGEAPDDAAISAELEEIAARVAAGLPVGDAAPQGQADGADAPDDDAEEKDELGLDFDLDGLMGDLSVDAEEAAAIEAAAAEVERRMEQGDDIAAFAAEAPAQAEAPAPAAPAAAAGADGQAAYGWYVRLRFLDGALANGSEPLLMLRELGELGGRCLAVDAATLPTLDALDAEKAYFGWTFHLPARATKEEIEEIFDFIGTDCELAIEAAMEPVGLGGATVALAPVEPVAVAAEAKAEEAPAPVAAAPVPAPVPAPAPAPVPAPVASAPVEAAPIAEAAPASAPAADPAPAAAVPQAAPRAVNAVGQTVRVDLAKLDRLIDTVGELVIAQAMMAQRLAGHGLSAMDEMGMLDHLTREIQESAMSIRAQPIGSVFSRVPRIVRELEASTGKRVELTMSGEGTELDKTVVERLGEPLTHLIRNAVDHGLETPDVRLARGKPAEGRLHLSAEQRSGRILISISDDGAGINREVVLKKAIERGLVAPGAQLSNEEIDHLIFAPGFSTAQQVSNISGRGVGMDVVRQNVKDLGGRISIESRPGEGCTFTLALPLTLAIADGMIVTVGDQTVVIPLTHVLESLRPEQADVQFVGKNLMVLNNRGRFLPIVPLDLAVGAVEAVKSADEAVLIVVDTESHGQAVLMVDSIVDQRQFVIKSLEAHYQPISGVAGATILGDGKVALILDVDALVADNFTAESGALAAA
ncbi:two-component system chemotaxis sensor kinase CheA [Sphingobium jiangsuense]|uniref:Chemotaxis protein CheA n=3 Tax=Sphingobium jiangsuense TaxID=870476 RepID=A0A7W6BN48_9SPHN|nr:chemotaxis protein CheA [Sphingobium jiangsuense]MBB3924759.1 two-component system chemotaxis sensor kinase CheA [Sphingobium jiangsuense]